MTEFTMKLTKSTLTLKTILLCALLTQSAVAASGANGGNTDGFAMPLQALGHQDISKTVRVTAKTILSSADKERFYAMGVDTILYAGGMHYYFYLPESLAPKLLSEPKISGISEIDPANRMESLHSGALSLLGDDDIVKVHLLFLKEMRHDEVAALLQHEGIDGEIIKVTPQLRSARIKLHLRDYKKLSHVPLIQYMDRVERLLATDSVTQLLETRNAKTAKQSSVTALWSDPYNLDGRNIAVGVVDGGAALTTHQEFGGRVHDRTSDGEVILHSTHVTGTITAAGVNAKARGMANAAEVFNYSFTDDAFSDAVLNMYSQEDILFSNHSYGYSLKERLGEYDSVAATQDLTVANNPYLNIFEAAGNDGIDGDYAEYGIIKGPGNSKNILTIGAVNTRGDNVAELSSTGPVRDGRIKPDLCVRGEYVTSTSGESDTSYVMMSGTSMAAPAATGMGVLIAQAYKRVTGGYDIRHDTLKAVLINTADDIANPGPDYKAGFGRIDAKAAVDTIETIADKQPKVHTDTVNHTGSKRYSFTITHSDYFKATIAWVDPEADPRAAETLVNDIDMVLQKSDTGVKYYPYTLDPDHPAQVARQDRPNHVDNIEQIEVRNLPAGSYDLIVKGSRIVTDRQEYTVVSNLPMFNSSNIERLRPSKIQNFARKIFLATL